MKIFMPISANPDQHAAGNLVLFGQTAQVTASSYKRVTQGNWQKSIELLAGDKTIQKKMGRKDISKNTMLLGVDLLGNFLEQLESMQNEEVVILHPSAAFDSSAYNYLLQSALPTNAKLHRYSIDCYGAPLAYLSKKIIEFEARYQPTIAQLELYMAKLNLATRTYLVGRRTKELDPNVTLWRIWLDNIITRRSVYRSNEVGWQPMTMKIIMQEIADLLPTGARIWLDVCRDIRGASKLRSQLLQRRLPKARLTVTNLHHVSRNLAPCFVFLTVTPDEKQLFAISQSALNGI